MHKNTVIKTSSLSSRMHTPDSLSISFCIDDGVRVDEETLSFKGSIAWGHGGTTKLA
jgi:hypothetical protein